MKLSSKHIAAMASLVLATASVAVLGEEPKLPAGHPALPAANDAPALPSGHPDISKAGAATQPALPAGHPALPGAGSGQLPAGHPGIGNKAVKPAAGAGSISIRAYQGTKDAPAVAGDPVVVELYHRGALLQKVESKLDAKGETVVTGLPLSLPFQPLIRVKHAGVDYQAAGNPMDADPRHAAQKVELAVFETTEEAPDWNVQMMHLMLVPAADGIHVNQMIAVSNPGDRSWLGKKEGDKRVSLTLSLPAGASDIGVGGALRDGCDQLPDGRLVNRLPLSPGVSQMQLEYVVPLKDGKATLNFVAPAATGQMMVVVPEGTTVAAKGLDSDGLKDMGTTKAQIFKGANLKTGQEVSLTLTPGPAPANKKAAAQLPNGSSDAPKIIAGVGGGVLLAVCAAVVFMRPAAKAPARAGK